MRVRRNTVQHSGRLNRIPAPNRQKDRSPTTHLLLEIFDRLILVVFSKPLASLRDPPMIFSNLGQSDQLLIAVGIDFHGTSHDDLAFRKSTSVSIESCKLTCNYAK
jgi:hypothetical protein